MKLLSAASSGALSAFCAFLLASGCGSDGVGVDACRDIEQARCEAGRHCGFVDDVEQCQRFYRDHCLHGLKTSKTPGDVRVDECVGAIKLAGQCRRDGKEHLADCELWTSGTDLTSPCDVIRYPEQIKLCDFLVSTVDAAPPAHDTGPDGDDAASDAVNEAAADSASSD